MAEQASHLSREAKGLQQGLKEALKTRDPWDKDVEFQRKNLRRQYLRLLLVHPYARESKDAETHLWMQTSYAFISIYKQRLTALDRTLQSTPRHQPRQGGHGPVEYRKLMQRFRQFLAEEDKFWTQLVVRLRRSFGLDEAQSAMVVLGILPADEASNTQNPESTGPSHHREESATNGRNQYQFPPEDSTPSVPPNSTAERADWLAIMSKALVCLGDIARYRELYNESGGRPKAGHEDSLVPARKIGRGKKGGAAGMDFIPRARNYDKAQQCYEQARLLVPYEGNPSHQLAILSSYQKDSFGSLAHYYRALCVLQPYDTASENLGTVLSKVLDQWKVKMRREKEKNGGKILETDGSSLAPRLRVENFKEKVVVLHALWRLGVEKMEAISPKHAQGVIKDFASLVSERVLPIDTISKVIILAEGALWKHRTIRDPTSSSANFCPVTLESHVATHVLGLHRVLLEVGLHELAESPPKDAAESDLAQRITATFRRTLPALRIAGKWLRANFKYVLQGQQSKDIYTTIKKDKRGGSRVAITGLPLFWMAYAQFISALFRSFPAQKLPSLTSPLEEDVEMKGFLPLRKLMGEEKGDAELKSDANKAASQVHPNEEQLMRIADLLNDAKALTELENSPLALRTNGFVAKAGGLVVQTPHVDYTGRQEDIVLPDFSSVNNDEQSNSPKPCDRNDDIMTETSRTDDDPVGDAFRQVIDGSDGDIDDEEPDEVVYPRAAGPTSPSSSGLHPVLSSPPRATPMSPTAPSFTPRSPPLVSPIRRPVLSPLLAPPLAISATSTAAQDLENHVKGLPLHLSGGDISQLGPQESSAPQPPLLFGSDPSNFSIWSMSRDDNSFKPSDTAASAQSIGPYESPKQPLAKLLGQTPWSSTYGNFSQGSQNHAPAMIPSGFGSYPHLTDAEGHQRTPSATNFFSSSQSTRNDTFGYSSKIPPQSYYSHATSSRSSDAYFDPAIPSAAGTLYPQTTFRNPSLHDPRLGQTYAPPVPQLWGNNG